MYVEKTDYDDIEMSSRLRNVLRRNGFESLEGLRERDKENSVFIVLQFLNIGFSVKSEDVDFSISNRFLL